MKNRIDLSNINIRTDLLIDHELDKKILKKQIINDNISITNIKVDKSLQKQLQKKEGTYITIEFTDITNNEDRIDLEKTLTNEIKKLLTTLNIKETDEGLIIGLGNIKSTPDSLGPKTIEKILVTRHLFELNKNVKPGIRNISAFSPNVMANTGIETKDIIEGIINKTIPKFLIIIDALASSSIDRINKTIQLTDTGINPGRGIGNNRKELSPKTLNIPIITIGVPTVVESSIIVNDTINYLFKHLSYLKNNYETNKLIVTRNKKYLNTIKDLTLSNTEKEKISGILGTLTNENKLSLINEVLRNINHNMIVTPKEIDFLIEKLSTTIANSINKSLHKSI